MPTKTKTKRLHRTELAGVFAAMLNVDDTHFLDWQDAHLDQNFVAGSIHILIDTRYNKFAVFVEVDPSAHLCQLVFTNIQP